MKPKQTNQSDKKATRDTNSSEKIDERLKTLSFSQLVLQSTPSYRAMNPKQTNQSDIESNKRHE